MMVENHEATATAILRRASYPALRLLSCRLDQERLVVAGDVPSFYLKQLAQTLLLDRFGNSLQVENHVAVSGHGPDARTPTEG